MLIFRFQMSNSPRARYFQLRSTRRYISLYILVYHFFCFLSYVWLSSAENKCVSETQFKNFSHSLCVWIKFTLDSRIPKRIFYFFSFDTLKLWCIKTLKESEKIFQREFEVLNLFCGEYFEYFCNFYPL